MQERAHINRAELLKNCITHYKNARLEIAAEAGRQDHAAVGSGIEAGLDRRWWRDCRPFQEPTKCWARESLSTSRVALAVYSASFSQYSPRAQRISADIWPRLNLCPTFSKKGRLGFK